VKREKRGDTTARNCTRTGNAFFDVKVQRKAQKSGFLRLKRAQISQLNIGVLNFQKEEFVRLVYNALSSIVCSQIVRHMPKNTQKTFPQRC